MGGSKEPIFSGNAASLMVLFLAEDLLLFSLRAARCSFVRLFLPCHTYGNTGGSDCDDDIPGVCRVDNRGFKFAKLSRTASGVSRSGRA